MDPGPSAESWAPKPGSLDGHRLLTAAARLKEVRRRCAAEDARGDRIDTVGDRLDAVVSKLESAARPGGAAVGYLDLDLDLAVVEQMMEAVGLPVHARVVANVRDSLRAWSSGSTGADDEPPPPRRYVPPSADVGRTGVSRTGRQPRADDAGRRAPSRRGRRTLLVLVAVACFAAMADMVRMVRHADVPAVDSTVSQPPPVDRLPPAALPEPAAATDDREQDAIADHDRDWERFNDEIAGANRALGRGDLDLALRHFAGAAAIDRHHQRVEDMGKRLVDALLGDADAAFDDGEWELAASRVDDARRIARGLYLETSRIESTARKYDALTRFEDVGPDDRAGLSSAVGRAVRVTLTDGDRLFGRLESIDDGTLLLDVLSGVEGGGVRFSKRVPLGTVAGLRVFEAARPSETVLEP